MIIVPPSLRTAAFVERYTIVESDDEATRVLLPEAGLHLGVRYRGGATLVDNLREERLGNFVVTGLRDRARTMRTHARSGIVVALFKVTGTAAIFPDVMHELFGGTASLETFVERRDVERLGEQMGDATTHEQRIAIVEEFLATRVVARPRDRIVEAAVRALVASHGTARIGILAEDLAIHQDRLEKRFRRVVGGTPKQLASILRVRRAIELGRAGTSWSSVAYQAGYFDQSHFIREFRTITGQPPARFFRRVEHC
jgi:AraC-like DNA-binding protein